MKYYFYLIVSFFIIISCQSNKETIYIIHGEAQGSTYAITYIDTKETIVKREIDSILEVIDLSMSTYRDDSIISKINANDSIIADNHFRKVLETSQNIYKESNGYFDPSIGILIDAWGFGRKEKHQVPTQQVIDSLLLYIGMDKVYIDDNNFVHKKTPYLHLNFNAIAQGYTCDVIANYFKQKGIINFIVEVGGEMVISGRNTIKNKKWTIGIDNPLQETNNKREIIETIELENVALATSGNYRKVWTDSISGKKYVHTLNPKTGYPEQSNLLSVTVIAPTAIQSDGYATTFMALGLEKSKELLNSKPELKVLFMYQNSSNKDKIITERYNFNN